MGKQRRKWIDNVKGKQRRKWVIMRLIDHYDCWYDKSRIMGKGKGSS